MKKEHVKLVFSFLDESINEYIKESVWAIPFGKYYQIDNIPFYAYLYSCDDIVDIEVVGDELIIKKLIVASGNSTIRLLFEEQSTLEKIKEELSELGYESESNLNGLLLAINIPKAKNYLEAKNYFEKGEENGLFQYEEACISEHHSNDF